MEKLYTIMKLVLGFSEGRSKNYKHTTSTHSHNEPSCVAIMLVINSPNYPTRLGLCGPAGLIANCVTAGSAPRKLNLCSFSPATHVLTHRINCPARPGFLSQCIQSVNQRL